MINCPLMGQFIMYVVHLVSTDARHRTGGQAPMQGHCTMAPLPHCRLTAGKTPQEVVCSTTSQRSPCVLPTQPQSVTRSSGTSAWCSTNSALKDSNSGKTNVTAG